MTSKLKCPDKRIKLLRGKGLDDFSKEVYLRWAKQGSEYIEKKELLNLH